MNQSRIAVVFFSLAAGLVFTAEVIADDFLAAYLDVTDLAIFSEELDISAEQESSVHSHFMAYLRAIDAGLNDAERRTPSVRDIYGGPGTDPQEAFRAARTARAAVQTEWRTARQGLQQALLDDVKALLTDAQRERWPSVERRLRREKTLDHGALAGESLDLLGILRAVEPLPSAAVVELLDAYAVDLDTVLRIRNDAESDSPRYERDPGYDAVRDVNARIAVRDVNLSYAERIAASLPPEPRGAFLAAIHKSAFPHAYRKTGAHSRLEVVARSERLDGTQREAVLSLFNEYLVRREHQRDRTRELYRRHEPKQYLRRLERQDLPLENHDDSGDAEDPIRAGLAVLQAIDDETLARLRSLLTPEQAAAILGPERPSRDAGLREGPTTIEQQEWVMKEFDADRDGRLDDSELSALRAHLRIPLDERER